MRSTQFIAARRGRTAPVRPKQGLLRRLPRGRVAKVGAGLGVAFLLVLVPAAQTALDPTDTATGTGALASENGGEHNTADGFRALHANTTGSWNTAVGSLALDDNTTADNNTAVGFAALQLNTTGRTNTALGAHALDKTTTGFDNTAVGWAAMADNETGFENTAVGVFALALNTTGEENTAVGELAGTNFDNPNSTGSHNTFLGFRTRPGAPTQLDNATAIGANAVVSESNALVLGAAGTEVGIGTTTPDSLLQVGGLSSSYGDYLQIPMVTSLLPPPASDCSSAAHFGRLVLEFDPGKLRVTLWVCRPGGLRGVPPSWIGLAKEG
jgi:hypothetical protein